MSKWLKNNGYGIEEKFPGIYYINKEGCFKMQVITANKLGKKSHKWLNMLKTGLKEAEARQLVQSANTLSSKAERDYADSVLQVAVKANRAVFNKIKEESENMCEALKELMAPEFEQAKADAEREGMAKGMAEGRDKGIAEGIKIFILDNLEEGKDEQTIIGKLVRLFHVGADEAKKFYDEYSAAAVQ